jgi:hypothetical protein
MAINKDHANFLMVRCLLILFIFFFDNCTWLRIHALT